MNLKPKHIFLFIFIFFYDGLNAQISKNDILNATDNFILENEIFQDYTHKSSVIDLYSENKTIAHLVKLNPQGYIIFTSSEKIHPIFSYSEIGDFNIQEAKANPIFQSLFNNLNKKIEAVEKNPSKFSEIINRNKDIWNDLLKGYKNTKEDYQYGYYLTDLWGGVNCWDNEGNFIYPSSYFTPNHYSPGCVAISASQILNYYEWPPRGIGSYTTNDNQGSSQGSYYAGFGRTEYDWKNMLDDYQGEYSTDKERRAIGRLMYHLGVAVDMDYEDLGSTSNVNRIPNAFQSYFRATGHYQTWSWSEFGIRLRENLENKMPVQFGVEADNGEQHACVCDGYRYNEGEDKFYHLNMGWWNWYGGNAWYNIYDGFYALGYTIITGGVFDILPKPMINPVKRTSNSKINIINWNVSENLNWEAFELQESYNNGTWTTINSSITDTLYERTVTENGIYKYRVRAKVNGSFYSDSWSNIGTTQVGVVSFLDFDGDDSFFVNDSYDKLDVSDNWTYEAWVKVDSYNINDWSVIMDRRGVFSLYLLDDADADFAIRFAVRDGSDNIITSLRSDNSDTNLNFNEWFHFAVSFDGTDARLFLNGKLIEESNDANFNLTSSTNALNIGARYWGSYSRYLDGKIDEVRVSDTAYYTQEFCPDRFTVYEKDDNTRLLLNFQYGTGTALYDAAHNFLYVDLRSSPNTANWQTEISPIVNIQPQSQAECSGNVGFNIDAANTNNYQWQINEGTGFNNLVDNSNISGAQTNSLSFIDVSTFAEDNIIRCILSNSNVAYTCTDEVELDVYGNCTVWNGINWSNGTPDATKSAIIDANYIANEFLVTDKLTINENDTLFIAENYTLTVNGDFINKGTLYLMSENPEDIPGTFIHYSEVYNYGEMIAQKVFSAPYPNTEDNSFYISNPANTDGLIYNLFDYEPNVFENTGKINEWSLLNLNDKISPGKAYLYQFNDYNKVKYAGNFNTGYRSNNLKQLGDDDFFAFISNPYPSYINWNDESGWLKENISTSLYNYDIYNNGNSFNYSAWDGIVGIHSGNGYIKPMESYFVYMNDFRATLDLDNNVRVSTNEIETTVSMPNNLIRFQFENSDASIIDEAVLYFSDSENKTLKINPISDTKHYTFFPSAGKKYAIERIEMLEIDTLISVGFKTSQGGEITFKVTDFTFDENTPVQLKDLWTGETMMLTNGSEYIFTTGTSEPDNRFKLYFGDYVTSANYVNNEFVEVWASENNIYIQNKNNEDIYYQIIDITGKVLKNGITKQTLTKLTGKSGINFFKIKTQYISKAYKFIFFK